MTVNRRLVSLTAGHLVLGMIAGLLAFVEFPGVVPVTILWMLLDGVATCQVSLLAVWGTTSTGSPRTRMAGLVAGTVYLEALFSSIFGRRLAGMSIVMVTMTMAALLVVRALGMRLIRFDGRWQPAPPRTEGLRFSIRGLMLLAAAVAVLCAGGKALQERPGDTVSITVVWTLCSVPVGLVALWAALGSGRPLWRGPVVLASSLVFGAFFAVTGGIGADPAEWVHILAIMLLYSTLLFGSLLVVRSCGYRFVCRVGSTSKPPVEQTGSLALETPADGVNAPE